MSVSSYGYPWFCDASTASNISSVGVAEDVYATAPRKHFSELKAESQVDKAVLAPVNKGDTVGTLNVTLAGETILSKPLVAMDSIAEGGFFRRLYDAVVVMLEK